MGGGHSGRTLAIALAVALLAGLVADLGTSVAARSSNASEATGLNIDATQAVPPTPLSGGPGLRPAWTPFVQNVRVNSGPSPLRYQVEPSMAINSQGRIFVGWKEAPTGTAGGQRVGFSYSTDGGMTWASNIIMPVVNLGNLQSDPWLTVTRDDRVFFTRIEYGTPDGIAVTNTTDGVTWGTTWFYDDSPNFADKESAAHDAAGNLYWVWNTDSATQDLAFTRSNDGGASFVPKVILSDRQGTLGGIVQTAPCDCVYATWWQYSTDDVLFDRSFDGGLTWGTDVRVNNIPGSAESPLGSDFIVLPAMAVAPNGTIYVVWNDYRNGRPGGVPNGNSDIYLSHSVDQGATWSPAVLVNDDATTARQFMPDLAIDPFGMVHVAWEDDRTGEHNIYYANSTDGGSTFGPNVRVSTVGTPLTYTRPGDYFAIESAPNGTVSIVWTDGRNADLDIFFASLPAPDRYVLNTVPAGLALQIDGNPVKAPYWFDCTPGIHTISAVSPQGAGTTRNSFRSWSDGGSQMHDITCPSAKTYTAYFATEELVTVGASPPGLELIVDGSLVSTPQALWWEDGSVHTLEAPSPQVQGATRYVFAAWSDGGARYHTVAVCTPSAFTATFGTEFETIVATSPTNLNVTVDGTTGLAPQTFWWAEGSAHVLDVPSPQVSGGTNATFSGWSDGGTQNHTVVASAPQTYTANFGLQYRIIVATQPPGLQVTVDGNLYPAPYTFWCDSGSTHAIGAPTPTMGPGTRATFLGWSDAGAQNHTVGCLAPATFTATFGIEYRVDIDTSPSGLRVLVNGTSYTAPLSLWVPAASIRTIGTASPQPGPVSVRYVWTTWSDGGASSHAIVVSAPLTLVATFGTQYRLTLQSAHGSPVCDVADCWYDSGGTATFQVEATVPGGSGVRYTFLRWSGDLTTPQRGAAIPMDAPKTETAEWVTEYSIAVVTAKGTGTGAGWYVDGTSATFGISPGIVDGTAGTRYVFAAWSGDSTAGSASATIPMTGPKTVTATWRTEHLLTVVSAHGTSQGAGWHAENDPVAVSIESTVTVNGTTFRFTGWSGDATSSDASFAITMDGPKTIRAAWEAAPPSQAVLGGLGVWLALLVVLFLIVAFFLWRRRRRDDQLPSESPPEPPRPR